MIADSLLPYNDNIDNTVSYGMLEVDLNGGGK